MAVLFGIGSKDNLSKLRQLGFRVETNTEQEVQKVFGTKMNLPRNTIFMKIFLESSNMDDIIEALKHLTKEYGPNECESIVSNRNADRSNGFAANSCRSGNEDDRKDGPSLRLVR